MATLSYVEEGEPKRVRNDDALVVFGDDDAVGEVDEVEAPFSKRQRSSDRSESHFSPVHGVSVQPRDGSTCSDECLSAVIGSEEDGSNVESISAVRDVEKSLIGEKPGGSSDSAVSEKNAARILRALEEELSLSESEDRAVVSSIRCTGEEEATPRTTTFASWGDGFWNMPGFSSAAAAAAAVSVGCSSSSNLTDGDFAVCERFDILPMLNQGDNALPLSNMCFHVEDCNERVECAASSAGAEKARRSEHVGREKAVPNDENRSMTPVAHGEVPAFVDTLENARNAAAAAVTWSLEEGFDVYSGFSDIALGDEWMTPAVDSLEFLLDSSYAYGVTSFVEELVPF
ncbi:unnamed protein product [Sphagnum troendelagicum]|uniref:Uncharacterized protein n=1 Tax=Sphagnum troendelagicum TaxID=128251 RepID=A0ABP0U873_9BRYO